MKILYLSSGFYPDYQCDLLLHGLRSIFGDDVVDSNKIEHLYTDSKPKIKLYGKGFTYSGILDGLDIDRSDIPSKIRNHFFDLIVYGSIWRCQEFLNLVLEHYPKNKIIAVDGEDENVINPVFKKGIPYFKREMPFTHPRIFHISFAFPTNKLHFNNQKIRDYAICDPRDRRTYIYDSEESYFNGYRESRFAYTCKKAGWDCLRHYEILGNGCIPVFLDIEKCPDLIMTRFPKSLCKDVLKYIREGRKEEKIYQEYSPLFEEFTRSNLTTTKLAEYFISTVQSIKEL